MRPLLTALLGLFLFSASSLQAQDSSGIGEILTLLKTGADVFEPDLWQAKVYEFNSQTRVSWSSRPNAEFNGVSTLTSLHFDNGYTLDHLDEFFDKAWFAAVFVNWGDTPHQIARCSSDDLTLYEFKINDHRDDGESRPYWLRYWVEPVSAHRVRDWSIAIAMTDENGEFDDTSLPLLDAYAARMFPDLPACAD